MTRLNLLRGIRGAGTAALTAMDYTLLRTPLASSTTRTLYSTIAPNLYRRWYPTDFGDSPADPDPFKLAAVDPERVNQFTPRVYPPWRNRTKLFGTVRAGDWDRRPLEAVPRYDGPPEQLFLCATLEECPLYRAIKRHFEEGVAWEDTEFVQEVLSLVEDGIDASELVWQDCRVPADVHERCARLDDLYQDMAQRGCLSCHDRIDPETRDRNFLEVMENEIVVDVGRDGELLLVSGKHRLSIAHALGLETIPIAFLVRHADWMQVRKDVVNGNTTPAEEFRDHPDLRDVVRTANRPVTQGVSS